MESVREKNIKKLLQSGDLGKRESHFGELLKVAGLGTNLKEIIGYPVLIHSLSHSHWEVVLTNVVNITTDCYKNLLLVTNVSSMNGGTVTYFLHFKADWWYVRPREEKSEEVIVQIKKL